jgi:hypothetical protein
MGDKVSKAKNNADKHFEHLSALTGLKKSEIKRIYDNYKGELSVDEFCELYAKLRPEHPEPLDEIASKIFKAFDSDRMFDCVFYYLSLMCQFILKIKLKTFDHF